MSDTTNPEVKPCRICGKPTEVVQVDDINTTGKVEAPCGRCVLDIVCP